MGGRGASSGINRVGMNKLKKGIKSYRKRIKEHESKINNLKKTEKEWTGDKIRENIGLIKHWEKEIRAFNKNISDDLEKIRRYKEDGKS